ncbi:nicotinate phosphoribosyltransferase [Mycoplasma sp. NEAQ87857]|uniref:nicotinate phosphoribosyltransferase n=1 Tax=Mycoplasma sp. NEAQ87857 TaxID=2683967 RepID=UPI001316AD60|nr:nicotinate phosphoribosyltransferase [Mycoplasma sp. NEAQ87857]QGZ97571.1 nicotinate phosphoribosyltransferase [Mycoplasma sp. NEAQ87857]
MKDKKQYIASYFHKTKTILENETPNNEIVLQFFQRKDNAILGGMNEVLELLEAQTNTNNYKIKYLPEGTLIHNCEVVLELIGPYHEFGIWEGMIDGILARSTSIASNAYKCVQAANGKDVIFMGDRADHYLNQEVDGKAVALGGIKFVSTLAQKQTAKSIDDEAVFGSMPHALIQSFDGDVVKATEAYIKYFPNHKIISLVDYNNNVIEDATKIYQHFGNKVYGVRVDTGKAMCDHMFDDEEPQYGVTPEQIFRLRQALDDIGAKDYKIIVSSGFNAKKIALFEGLKVPVDFYGVGHSIFSLNNSFSADATMLNGKEQAKEGRFYRHNENLVLYQPKNKASQ